MSCWLGLPTLFKENCCILLAFFTSTAPTTLLRSLQVEVKNAQTQAQRAHAQQPPLRPGELLVPAAIKFHPAVVNGVVGAVAMLVLGPGATLSGEILAKLSVIAIFAVQGPAKLDACYERLW